MSLELIEFIPVALDTPQKSGGWKKLGHIKVRISDDIDILMEVIENKNKNFWFKVPNTKAGDEYRPVIYFNAHKEFNKHVTDALKDEFKAKYL